MAERLALWRDRYEPRERLARGGEATVWHAWDHQHDRPVALKVRAVRNAEDKEAVLDEARALLSVRPHPSIALARDDFFADGSHVMVMDWVEGTDLASVLAREGEPGLHPAVVVGYLSQVAEALDHLHAHDPPVVHGDVKPANLVLASGRRIVLVDFGLAGPRGAGRGTPGFVAPEVAAGGTPSPASDIYGLGATAMTLLTGASLTQGRPTWDGIEPSTAAAFERALRRALATDPARRPTAARHLVERLRYALSGSLPEGVVTLLLTDIEGSTALWDTRPDEMGNVVDRHEQVIGDVIERHGGRLIKSRGEGDSTFSVFVRGTDAVQAALDLHTDLAAEPWPDGIDIRVRIGLHTGQVEQRAGDYHGPTPNRAARIRAQARAGETLVSRATADIVADSLPADVGLVEVGTAILRGMSRAETVYRLERGATTHGDDLVHRPGPALVGRHHERALLDDLLGAVHGGTAKALLLSGEPGIGKTTLAGEAARLAKDRRMDVRWARAHDVGTPTALSLWTQVLALPDGDNTGSRHQLAASIASELIDHACRQSLLLVLDDLQWADATSLDVLALVWPQLGSAPVFVVATFRSTDLDGHDALLRIVDRIGRPPGGRRVDLSGLDQRSTAALLEREAAGPVAETVAQKVHEQTAGNPFFVAEVARVLASGQPVEAAATASGVRALVHERLARLPDESVELLSAAALLGSTVDVHLLAAACDTAALDVLTHLDPAVNTGLLVTADRTMRFSHDLLRDVLRASVPPSRRASLHRAAAAYLQDLVGEDVTARADELVRHLVGAGPLVEDPSILARWALVSGDRAMAATGYAEAVAAYELATENAPPDSAQALDARLRLIRAARLAGDDRTQELTRAATALADRRGDACAHVDAVIESLGPLPEFGDTSSDVLHVLEDALAVVPAGDAARRSVLRARLALERDHKDPLGRQVEEARAALAESRLSQSDFALLRSLHTLSWLMRDGAEAPQKLDVACEMRDVARRVGDIESEMSAIVMSAGCSLQLGRREDAEALYREHARLANRTRIPLRLAYDALHRNLLALLDGRFDDVADGVGAGVQIHPDPNLRASFGMQLFTARREQGRLAELEDVFVAAAENRTEVGAWLALLYAETGRPDLARRQLDRIVGDIASTSSVRFWFMAPQLSETAVLLDDSSAAAHLYDGLLPHAGFALLQGVQVCHGAIDRFLGKLALLMGRRDDAVAHLDDAAALERGLHSPLFDSWTAAALDQAGRA